MNQLTTPVFVMVEKWNVFFLETASYQSLAPPRLGGANDNNEETKEVLFSLVCQFVCLLTGLLRYKYEWNLCNGWT